MARTVSAYPLVVRGQEAHDGDQQQGCVQLVVLVGLTESAPFVDAPLQDVLFEGVGPLAPAIGPLRVTPPAGQVGAAVGGHPAQDGGSREVLGFAADLPDALIGIDAVGQRVVDQAGQAFPHGADDLGRSLLQMLVDAVEQHAPHVVLVLVPGAVAHPDRTGPVVPGQVVQCGFAEVALPADPVHDLEIECLVEASLAHALEDEGEVLQRLPVEAQPVEGPKHEPGVADPRVPVVPVPAPPGVSGRLVVAAAMMAPVGA